MGIFFHVDRLNKLNENSILEPMKFEIAEKYLGYSDVTAHGQLYLMKKPPIVEFYHNGIKHIESDGAIELFFESIRLMRYPDRPSRFQSFFALENLNDAQELRSIFRAVEASIWMVEANQYFKADMNLLKFGQNGLSALTNVNMYWLGESSNNPMWEVLLQPPIKLLERVISGN